MEEESVLAHDVMRVNPVTGRGRRVQYEANEIRLDKWLILIVTRNVNNQFQRF